MLNRAIVLIGLSSLASFCTAQSLTPPPGIEGNSTPPGWLSTTSDLLDPSSPGSASNPSPDGSSSIKTFQVAPKFTDSQKLPDAPSAISSNTPHGMAYGLLGSTLSVPDLAASFSLPRYQFGGEVGGGIDQGHSSYFVSYDQLSINRSHLLSNLATHIGTGESGLLARANNLLSSALAARADHQFSTHDSGYLSYTRDQMTGNSLAAGRDAALPPSATGLNTTQQSLTAANTFVLSANTVNQTSAQILSTSVELPAGAQTPDLQSSLPSRRVLHVLEAADNIYRQVGGQGLHFGGDFLASSMSLTFLENGMGRRGNPSLSQSTRAAGLYIQQARQLQPNLLLTAGARYDAQFIPDLGMDMHKLSPQVGLAWSPNSARTVFRGGLGIDYDRTPLPTFAGSIDPSVPANLTHSAQITNPGPASLSSFASFDTVSPTIQNAYAEHANFEVEQKLPARIELTGQYQYTRGVQLERPVYRAETLCAAASCNAGNEFGGRQTGTGATSTYNGATIALTQTAVHWGSYNVAYTYSSAQSSGTGDNLASIDDAMRRLSFTGVLHTSLDVGSTLWQRLDHGWVLSSGADYLKREEFAGLDFINVNARLTKNLVVGQHFQLQAVVQTFNMIAQTDETFDKAVAAFDGNGTHLFQAYTRIAEAQSPDHTEGGLRLTF